MKDKNRRLFIKKSTAAAGLLLSNTFGHSLGKSSLNFNRTMSDYSKDGGMQFSLAYFWGPEPDRVALARQIDVVGAVGGITPRIMIFRMNIHIHGSGTKE